MRVIPEQRGGIVDGLQQRLGQGLQRSGGGSRGLVVLAVAKLGQVPLAVAVAPRIVRAGRVGRVINLGSRVHGQMDE